MHLGTGARYLGLVTLGLIGLLAGPISANAAAQASHQQVRVGPYLADPTYLHIGTYYRTTKAVTIRDDSTRRQFKLPKGTVVRGNRYQYGQHHAYMLVYTGTLSRQVVQPLWRGNRTLTEQSSVTTSQVSAFQRVQVPASLPANSYGDLYPGKTASATPHQRVVLTSNGYLEVHPVASGLFRQPTLSVKIARVTKHAQTRYLYLTQRVAGLTTKTVRHAGKPQYRLALTDQKRPFKVKKTATVNTYYARYSLGGHAYVTPLGTDGPLED